MRQFVKIIVLSVLLLRFVVLCAETAAEGNDGLVIADEAVVDTPASESSDYASGKNKSENDHGADNDIQRSALAKKYHQQIETVLEQEEFGITETEKAWRLIDTEDDETREERFPEWLISFLEWLENRSPDKKSDSDVDFGFVQILEIIFWVVAIGLILFVLMKYRDQIVRVGAGLRSRPGPANLPTSMFGLDVKKDSLPDDVVVSAKEHWQLGETRLAIGLLLRASLIQLLNDHQCRFYDSDTEAECCERIDHQAPKVFSVYMKRLVGVWQTVAYAHKQPSQDTFELLCVQWKDTFE